MKKEKKEKFTFYTIPLHSEGIAPLVSENIRAGFPSPANAYIEEKLDLNKYCVKNPPATFLVKVEGDSMINAGITKGDLLVVDRSAEPKNSDIVIAVLNGEFTLKRLVINDDKSITLYPENPKYKPIQITEGMDFEVWGKVIKAIKDF